MEDEIVLRAIAAEAACIRPMWRAITAVAVVIAVEAAHIDASRNRLYAIIASTRNAKFRSEKGL
jgi:hypothetical protein